MSMLNEPNIDSPANIDAGKQFRDDPDAYYQTVKALVLKTMDDF
jgi:ubiquitin-protein ligase